MKDVAGATETLPRPGRRRGVSPGRVRLLAVLAVVGPGLLAGLSDDDPAGITTYSVLGADYGYDLLWVLLLSTMALMLFHDLGSRMGVVTGQGLIGLIRHRYGVRVAAVSLLALVVANIGTAAAEFAGVAAGSELLGLSRDVSVPIAAVSVTSMVLLGNFHRVEHLLLALAAVFVAYVGAGLMAHPDWGAATRGLLVPQMGFSHDEALLVAATIGTTLAPWGLSFIQSYAVDKRLVVADLGYERVDVVTGAALTGVIGFFVVVACAETLHAHSLHIDTAADAATALAPLAGEMARTLFAIGLIGAALLAAAILPLSTAYSVCDLTGSQAALDSSFTEARLFYLTDIVITVIAASLVLLPNIPLVPLLVSTQTLNAVLLVPLLVVMHLLARDREVMGDLVVSRGVATAQLVVVLLVTASVALLIV
jgi:NRAMP (natural resistance-associated macrophage protein)-like metal ion transporter